MRFSALFLSPAILLALMIGTSNAAGQSAAPAPAASAGPAASAASTAPAATPTSTPDPKAARETAARTEAADFQRTCAKDFHLPFSRKIVFSLDGSRAYAILPVGKSPDRKLVVYEIQLTSGTVLPEFGLRNTLSADLMVTLDSKGFASSFAAVVADPAFSDCARGDLELISGVSASAGPIKRIGFLGVVPFHRTPVLFEPLTRTLLQLDTKTMQSRFLAKVSSGSYVVHADPLSGKQTIWDETKRTLTTISQSSTSRPRTIKVKDGYQVIQNMGRFAALKISAAANSVTIHEIPTWTGVTKEGEFNFKLPAENSVSQAMIWPNFDRKIALVTGRTDDIRRRWQKVFLVDYRAGLVIKEFKTSGVNFYGEVGISPNSKSIVMAHINGAESLADKLVIVDLGRDTVKEVTLPVP